MAPRATRQGHNTVEDREAVGAGTQVGQNQHMKAGMVLCRCQTYRKADCLCLYRFAYACSRSVTRCHEGDGGAIQVCLFYGAEISAIERRRMRRQQENFIAPEHAAAFPDRQHSPR